MKRQLFLVGWSILWLILSILVSQADARFGNFARGTGAFKTLQRIWNSLPQKVAVFTAIASILAIALLVRIVPLILLQQSTNFDIESFRLVGNSFTSGIDIYSNPASMNRHPYLPFQVYWIGFSTWLATHAPVHFEALIRLEPILADAAIALLIYALLLKSAGKKDAVKGSLLYAINPIACFVSAYHGQFDSIPVLWMLASVWMAQSVPALQGIFFGLSILSKSWPVLALPSMAASMRTGKLHFIFWVVAVPILGTLFYAILMKANLLLILQNAVSYNHGTGVWGYTYILRLIALISPLLAQPVAFIFQIGRYLTLLFLGVTWVGLCRKEQTIPSILTILLAFYVFTHAFSIQYLSWIVSFAILDREYKWLNRFTMAGFAYMLLAYNTLILTNSIQNVLAMPAADLAIIIPSSLPAWLVCIGWLVKRYQDQRETAVLASAPVP